MRDERPGPSLETFHGAVARSGVFLAGGRDLLFSVSGKAPRQMLLGVLTGSIPTPLSDQGRDRAASGSHGGGSGSMAGRKVGLPGTTLARGRTTASAVLTPKGKMIADLRVIPLALAEEGGAIRPEGEEGFSLLVPVAAADGLEEHFKRFLPPRLARARRWMGEVSILTVIGEAARRTLAEVGVHLPLSEPGTPAGGGETVLLEEPDGRFLLAVGNDNVGPPAWDLVLASHEEEKVATLLREAGLREAPSPLWRVLRLEKGRPCFGEEIGPDTIPVEAGMQHRAIDHEKGCYTGQEVIVRIRDRGRVNRHLRGLLLGDRSPPPPGTELFEPGVSRPRGVVSSAVRSPLFGETIGLGFVRREVEPPAGLRLGSEDGPEVGVREVDDQGWIAAEGDAWAPGVNRWRTAIPGAG